MLTKMQKKLIKSLHTKKGRLESGLCLVEGEKNIKEAGDFIEFVFTPDDADDFNKLVTTQTPQKIAAVARIPHFTIEDLEKYKIILLLDGVQDPGNVGAILRQCLAFDSALILVESVDTANPKVLRSSAGAFFKVPHIALNREDALLSLKESSRRVYRLEKRKQSIDLRDLKEGPMVIIAGSEGSGIKMNAKGVSVAINHNNALDSLNVANATAIVLHYLFNNL